MQAPRLDRLAERDDAVALFGEQRIAENHVRAAHQIAQPLHLVDDVRDRPRAVAGQNPVRAIRAELRAPAAREQRKAAAHRPRRKSDARLEPAILGDQIPARKRQRVQIVDLFADRHPARDVALRQAHHARFRLAVEDEVGVVAEQLGHLRRRDPHEADLHTARAHLIGPRPLRLVVDQR